MAGSHGTSGGLPIGKELEVKTSRGPFLTSLDDNFELGFGLKLRRSRASKGIKEHPGFLLEFLWGKESMERSNSSL